SRLLTFIARACLCAMPFGGQVSRHTCGRSMTVLLASFERAQETRAESIVHSYQLCLRPAAHLLVAGHRQRGLAVLVWRAAPRLGRLAWPCAASRRADP